MQNKIQDAKQKVKELLIATKYGVSAMEMPMIIQISQAEGLKIIKELITEGEDIHSLAAENSPEEMVLYSIGAIDTNIAELKK